MNNALAHVSVHIKTVFLGRSHHHHPHPHQWGVGGCWQDAAATLSSVGTQCHHLLTEPRGSRKVKATRRSDEEGVSHPVVTSFSSLLLLPSMTSLWTDVQSTPASPPCLCLFLPGGEVSSLFFLFSFSFILSYLPISSEISHKQISCWDY